MNNKGDNIEIHLYTKAVLEKRRLGPLKIKCCMSQNPGKRKML